MQVLAFPALQRERDVVSHSRAGWEALLGDPNDPDPTFRVTRLKNKLGKGQEPFNFHVNAEFKSPKLAHPITLEIQIWITPIMALNDVSHAQYEVSRAKSVGAI